MTMIVGMNLADYVLVASDKREVFLVNGKVDRVISDSVSKIIDWKGGYIAGSGYVTVLNALKRAVSTEEITNTDQIVAFAVDKTNLFSKHDPSLLKSSNWMFTYTTDSIPGGKSRLGIISAKEPDKLKLLSDMASTIWAKIPNLDSTIEELNDKLKSISEFTSLEESITYHAALLHKLFGKAALVDESVCPNYDFCIQLNDGSKGLKLNA